MKYPHQSPFFDFNYHFLGQNETKLIEKDIELQVKQLLNELRQKSLSVPDQFSEKEWSGEAARRLVKFEKIITKAFEQHPLVVSHTSGRVWTIWNAVVYCSTLYTTIGLCATFTKSNLTKYNLSKVMDTFIQPHSLDASSL